MFHAIHGFAFRRSGHSSRRRPYVALRRAEEVLVTVLSERPSHDDVDPASGAPLEPSVTLEEEAKFRVSSSFVVPPLAGRDLRDVVGAARRLDATYWDTPDLRLARRGHTLRYRVSDDGSEQKWTLKLGGEPRSLLLERREVSVDGDPNAPPRPLADALAAIVGARELVVVARLKSDQQQYRVEDRAGHRLLTVEDDRVAVLEGNASVGSFREVEVELVDADRGHRALAVAVKRLRRAGAGDPDPTAKLVRVLGPPAAREALPPLGPDSTIEEVVCAAVWQGLDQLLAHDPGVRLDIGERDVHQARVATRRLRAYLRTLRPLLDRTAVDHLREEIGWAGTQLGQVRDLDVLRHTFAAALESRSAAERERFLAVLDGERSIAHLRVLDAMRSARWRSMVHALELAAVLPPLRGTSVPTANARPVLRRLVAKSWRRFERRVDAAQDGESNWHEVRKAAKSTRYAAELFEPVIGAETATLAAAAEDIQTTLGEAQDGVVAGDWLRQHRDDAQIGELARQLCGDDDHTSDIAPDNWDKLWRRARRAAARAR